MPSKLEAEDIVSEKSDTDKHMYRNFTALLGSFLRKETFQGQEHLVAPVIALKEGVIQAMNAETPEFVSAQTISDPKTVLGFNGRPLFLGHPVKDGSPVPGNTPELLDKSSFGTVFNTASKGKNLTLEAWVNIEKANEVNPSIVTRLEQLAKENSKENQIEVSVGVFVDMDDNATGTYDGKKYKGAWQNIVPDHLAFLEVGSTGACSVEYGCGVRTARAAIEGVKMDENMYIEWLEEGPETEEVLKTLRNIPQSERDKMSASDFAGPNKSFPIAKPEDVAAASHALGRAKGGAAARAKIKSKIISIAYRKGSSFVAQLPDTWKRKSGSRQASMFESIKALFRPAISTTESDRDVRDALLCAIREMEPNCWDLVAVYTDRVIYSIYESGGVCLYQRAYSGNENAGYTVDGNRIEVEPVTTFEAVYAEATEEDEKTEADVKAATASYQSKIQQMHDHSVALGAECPAMKAAQMKAAEETKIVDILKEENCSCGGLVPTTASPTEEGDLEMSKAERIAALLGNKHNLVKDQKALEAASDETLAVLESHCATQKAAEEKAEADAKVAADAKAAEDAKLAAAAAKKEADEKEAAKLAAAASAKVVTEEPLTEAEVMAVLPKRLKDMIARQEAMETARHAELVASMKSAQSEFTEEELKTMDLVQLERISKVAKVPTPVVDFSARGVARGAADETMAPAPPNFNERVRAARAKAS